MGSDHGGAAGAGHSPGGAQGDGAAWAGVDPPAFGESGEPGPHVSGDYRSSEWSPDAAEAARRAREALASLAPAYREAIVLFEIEGWQVDELAKLLGVSPSAVKSRLARGRAQLRAYYEARHQAVPTLSGEPT